MSRPPSCCDCIVLWSFLNEICKWWRKEKERNYNNKSAALSLSLFPVRKSKVSGKQGGGISHGKDFIWVKATWVGAGGDALRKNLQLVGLVGSASSTSRRGRSLCAFILKFMPISICLNNVYGEVNGGGIKGETVSILTLVSCSG